MSSVYRNESTGNFRGVRLSDDRLQAPDGSWPESMLFYVVYPKGHTGKFPVECLSLLIDLKSL